MASFWEYFSEPPEEDAGSSFWDYFKDPDGPNGSSNSENPEADPKAPNAETRGSVQTEPCAKFFNEHLVFWAMRNLPVKEAVKHFLICGAIGTGKSTTIDLFLQSIAQRFKPERKEPEQLIIFDAKCDIIPKLAAFGFHLDEHSAKNNIWLINPYDRRSAVWDIAGAARSPVMARHFAALLVPEETRSSAPFFWTASRQLVYATILALNEIKPDKPWSLRDLLCALSSKERILTVTKRHPRAHELASAVLSDEQHSSGVVSTLATKIGHLEQVAALWHTSPAERETFSIKSFLEKPGLLILGNDPVLRESLWPINAMLLQSLSKEILRGKEVDGPRHWFVLDEFTAMERVDSIHELVNRGRSKGASVLLGLQGIDRLNELYGENGANDLLEQCSSKTFLRAGGPKTGAWIEQFFGQYRRTESSYSESWSKDGKSSSLSYSIAERSTFLASFFMNLPFTGPGRPYIGVSDVPCLGTTLITRRSFDEVNQWRVKADKNVETLEARDDQDNQTLEPWNPIELMEYCGELKSPEAAKGTELTKRNQRFSDSTQTNEKKA